MTKQAKSALLAAALALCVLSLATTSAAQTLAGTVTQRHQQQARCRRRHRTHQHRQRHGCRRYRQSRLRRQIHLHSQAVPAGPHLVRATHQGVTYFQFAPPGTSNVELKVYDVSKKVEGISLTADVIRFQADKTSLQGTRLFAVDNNSSPAVTQMSDRSFEFYLPDGAKILQLQAKAPNGQPIPADAVPEPEKGRYAISFPLRPGETQFELEFTVPYNGTAKIDPKPLYPAEHFVVVLPKSMHFAAADAASFKSMQDPNSADTTVQVAQQTKVGQQLAFSVTGTGTISEQPAQVSGQPEAGGQGGGAQGGPMNENPQAESNRPGGGLGVPIDAPDPLEKYRWPIIGAFAVLLAVGGWVVTKRQGAATVGSAGSAAGVAMADRAARASGPLAAPITGPGASAITGAAPAPLAAATSSTSSANTAAAKSAAILEALKEELFHLEVDRRQGKITEEDYVKTKAALDQTLDRALRRQTAAD